MPAGKEGRSRRRVVTAGAARPNERALKLRGALGADLGATWLRLVYSDEAGRGLRRVRLPAVHPTKLPETLGPVLRRWGVKPGAFVLGSTRMGRASDRRRLEARLKPIAARVRVITDLELSWSAAFERRPGVVLLAGTGSFAYGRDARGKAVRIGGLGPLLGDDGSAFWIGREWLRGRPQGEALSYMRKPDPLRAIAGQALKVLRLSRGSGPDSARARKIVTQAQAALADQVRAAASLLRFRGKTPVSWQGGLLEDKGFRSGVLRRLGRGFDPRPPASPPEAEALRLARLLRR